MWIILFLLRCKKVLVTKGGGEGGIDIIGYFSFPSTMHYILGKKGPIRVIAQAKKHSSKVQVGSIRDFCSVINSVKENNADLATIIPSWFYHCSGMIIPWFLSHQGLQEGAITKSNYNGIIFDDTIDIIESIINTECFNDMDPQLIQAEIRNRVMNLLAANPEMALVVIDS